MRLILKYFTNLFIILSISCLVSTVSASKSPKKVLNIEKETKKYLIPIVILVSLIIAMLIGIIVYAMNKASTTSAKPLLKSSVKPNDVKKSAHDSKTQDASSYTTVTQNEDLDGWQIQQSGQIQADKRSAQQRARDALDLARMQSIKQEVENKYKDEISRCDRELKTLESKLTDAQTNFGALQADGIDYSLPDLKPIALQAVTLRDYNLAEENLFKTYVQITMEQQKRMELISLIESQQSHLVIPQLDEVMSRTYTLIREFQRLCQSQRLIVKNAISSTQDAVHLQTYIVLNSLLEERATQFQAYFKKTEMSKQGFQCSKLLAYKQEERDALDLQILQEMMQICRTRYP